jgi:hypothetical protein
MMSRHLTARTLLLVLFSIGLPAMLTAQVYFDSRQIDINPGLLMISQRSILEIGAQADAAVYNSAFTIGEILQPTWTIDLNEVYEESGPSGLQVGTTANASALTSLRLFGFGLGVYARANARALLTLPQDLLQFVAEGNVEDYSGTGGVLIRATAEVGATLAIDVRGWTFGLGMGCSVPVAYSGDGGLNFNLETNESGFDASADLDLELYSALDLAAIQAGAMPDITSAIGRGAYKIDLGVVRWDEEVARWGVSLNDITIVRGRAPYAVRLTGSYSASMENVLQGLIEDPNASPVEFASEDIELTTIEGADRRITLAPGISGFYRLSLPYIDITPHAELVVGRGVTAFSPGITVSGNRFPTNLFYVGLGHSRPLWRAVAGLRLPLYVLELNAQVESNATRLFGLFSLEGLTAAVDLRIGF